MGLEDLLRPQSVKMSWDFHSRKINIVKSTLESSKDDAKLEICK